MFYRKEGKKSIIEISGHLYLTVLAYLLYAPHARTPFIQSYIGTGWMTDGLSD